MKKHDLKRVSILLTSAILLTGCNSKIDCGEANGGTAYDYSYSNCLTEEKLITEDVITEETNDIAADAIYENPFVSTNKNATSTFSADVDTASYSYIRNYIKEYNDLTYLDKNTVRIEEMINYFSYDYATPKNGEIFNVTTQATKCPWNTEHDLVMIGLNTEKIDLSDAPASNLVFLLDVSGSMADSNKLPLLAKSFSLLVDELDENDKVSIVTYAGSDEVLLEGVSGAEKGEIKNALESLNAYGSTNGGKGIITAYELAQEHFIEGGINRVILATDGDLNVGITSSEDLEKLITQKKETGIFLTTLGFGDGNYRDDNMELLADKGNGNYAYIDSLNEAKKFLIEEMGSTFNTVAKDVKFQVEFNTDIVEEYRLIGYENRVMNNEDFTDDTKDAGEIGSGHSVTALYEIKTKKQSDDIFSLKIRYKQPDEDKSNEITHTPTNLYTTPSADFNFIMAVAEFGMLLKTSEHMGNSTYENVLSLAGNGGIEDDFHKNEFIDLVKKVMDM